LFDKKIKGAVGASFVLKVHFLHVFVKLVSVPCLKGAIIHNATEDDVRVLGFLVIEEALWCFGRILAEFTLIWSLI